MTAIAAKHSGQIETGELRCVLEESLRAARGPSSRIVRLERRPSPYRSSFPLEELTVDLHDGTRLELVFKNANPSDLSAEARRAKPEFLDNPAREVELYRRVLDSNELGTAICYGSVLDPNAGRFWLFLERVAGSELYQVGEFALWGQAARWLARLHTTFAAADSLPKVLQAQLIVHDAAYYERWLQRALTFRSDPLLVKLAAVYRQLIHELTHLPASLTHGEFYASNILVSGSIAPSRVCAVDWERASWGPGLIDLAALTAGSWNEAEKIKLVAEYYSALQNAQSPSLDWDALVRGWHTCRLHLAVQWLGWSQDWLPPPEQQQNWLAEAAKVAERLGCCL